MLEGKQLGIPIEPKPPGYMPNTIRTKNLNIQLGLSVIEFDLKSWTKVISDKTA